MRTEDQIDTLLISALQNLQNTTVTFEDFVIIYTCIIRLISPVNEEKAFKLITGLWPDETVPCKLFDVQARLFDIKDYLKPSGEETN